MLKYVYSIYMCKIEYAIYKCILSTNKATKFLKENWKQAFMILE